MQPNLETYKKRQVDLSGLATIGDVSGVTIGDITKALNEQLDYYRNSRQGLERLWLEYYINYLTNPESAKANLTAASRHIGQVQTTWRHDLKSPGAYQTVETLVSFFMGAFLM